MHETKKIYFKSLISLKITMDLIPFIFRQTPKNNEESLFSHNPVESVIKPQ